MTSDATTTMLSLSSSPAFPGRQDTFCGLIPPRYHRTGSAIPPRWNYSTLHDNTNCTRRVTLGVIGGSSD